MALVLLGFSVFSVFTRRLRYTACASHCYTSLLRLTCVCARVCACVCVCSPPPGLILSQDTRSRIAEFKQQVSELEEAKAAAIAAADASASAATAALSDGVRQRGGPGRGADSGGKAATATTAGGESQAPLAAADEGYALWVVMLVALLMLAIGVLIGSRGVVSTGA